MGLTLGELATRAGAELHGDAQCAIIRVASLDRAGVGDIAFLNSASFRKYLKDTQASAVILKREDLSDCPVAALVTDNPHAVYARVAALLYPDAPATGGIHPSAVIGTGGTIHASVSIGAHTVLGDGVTIAQGARIGPGCVIGDGADIGADTRLVANVVICAGSVIGSRCLLHPGAVIGSDGFGLARDGNSWLRVPQLGVVRIGDDVDVGANTTIDRGALEDTVIGDGVKLDNLIQVAHNVRIGAHTAIAGCVGIAGSAVIGSRCTIGGGVGISGHLEIVDDVHITGMTFVTRSITKPGLYSSGMPADTNQAWRRNTVRYRQLDEYARRLKAMEKRLGDETSD